MLPALHALGSQFHGGTAASEPGDAIGTVS